MSREPHIFKPSHDSCRRCAACGRPFEGLLHALACGRPFEYYVDQPDTAERMRLAVYQIPFALPPKKEDAECP